MPKRLLVLSDSLGSGDEELGRLLMRNFLYSVARSDDRPSVIIMMNSGVRLACAGSDSVDDLRLCVDRGVSVRACGTCLDYLGLKDSLEVGEVGAMAESVAELLASGAVVTVG